MADRVAPRAGETRPLDERTGATRVHFLPRRSIGWWALVLLLATSLYPLYFGALEQLIGDDAALVAVAVIAALASIGVGSMALFVARDRSVLLSMAYALAVFLVLLGLLFALTLLFLGL